MLARYTGAESTFSRERNMPQCQRNSEHRGYNNAAETSSSPHPSTVKSIGYAARVQSEDTPSQQQEYAKPPKEIERKFIIDPTSDTFVREVLAGKSLDDFDHTTLRQGYLAIRDDGSEERIRSFGDMYFEHTMKSGGDLVRDEENTPLSRENFAALWPRTVGARVEKTRYQIPYQGVVLELDIYHGQLAGLCVGEVEFSGEDETAARAAANAFGTPAWVQHDVTTDGRFKNKRLATNSTIPVFYEQ